MLKPNGSVIKINVGDSGVAQVVEYLPSKQEA
jgi:hypothetical protein